MLPVARLIRQPRLTEPIAGLDDRPVFLLQARRRNTLLNHARRDTSSGAHP
ncbi:hypothetical protein [uncultured Aquitalea sp.]|uniref:hypothetical protein n=1 Tax=uncultured Aquitalea sp. TaxID=540272 RepID=UPI0025FAE78E|nr:hypothetical protein [uncultured Aquitalea sp.]